MKILFLADNYPPETNAAASRVHERARYWVEWGHDVTVLTSAPNFPEGRVYEGYRNAWRSTEVMDGIKVIRVKTLITPNSGVKLRILDFLSYMVSAFCFGLFTKRPDVVVATSPQFFCAVAGRALAGVKRVPFVFELSDLWPASIRAVGAMRSERLLKWVEKLELKLYRDSKSIVALTQSYKDDLTSRGIDGSKIEVIPNGVDIHHCEERPFDRELARSIGVEEKFVVGYVGTHGMAHALENVLHTAELMQDEDRVRFLLVGAGAQRDKLMAKAKDMGLKNVIFLPNQPKSKIGDYWRLLDVSLVHLKSDPLFATVIPSKVFEAMAYGLPVAYCGPNGEAEELIRREGVGLCHPAEDPQALRDGILRLLNDPILRTRLGEASKNAAPRHSRERQAANMLSALERVAGLRRSRHAVILESEAGLTPSTLRPEVPTGTSTRN